MPGSSRIIITPDVSRIAPGLLGIGALLLGMAAGFATSVRAADEPVLNVQPQTGEMIYQQMCLDCHGNGGLDLIDAHGDPLYGDRSLEELKKIITDTMPDGFPEDCVGEDAEKVAAYLHEALYTDEARSRNQPPRVELARMTNRQYENAVADLMAAFTGQGWAGENRGLQAFYYKSRNTRRDDLVTERVDPRVSFQFGSESPDKEKIENAEEFSMRWEGSVIAPDTGDYEFCVKTENGTRLWVNDNDTPLIDAWVASGGEVMEHRATLKLLGGRTYPLRLHWFKFKDKTASVELLWRPPHGTWEVVPERHLATNQVPPTLVVTTPFPPDDASAGYERGTAVSKEWDQATTSAAIEVANAVAARIDRLAGVRAGGGRQQGGDEPPATSPEERAAKVREFCARFAERAFRRPLTDEQRQFFVDARFEANEELETAVKQSVILVLKSPRFLYPDLGTSDTIDDYTIASRLSFNLWDSIPDDSLLKAAAEGALQSPEAVDQHANRMMTDPRARSKVRAFFESWLPMDEADGLSKDPREFPEFSDALVADLRTSLDLFIEDVVWSETSDYRQLLLSPELYLNDRLAVFYGAEVPQDGEFHKVARDPEERAGVVTHPFLMTALSYYGSSSPIHRGVFATRKLLGRALKPPPEAIQFMDGRFDPHMTMREKVTELTSPASCMGCHTIINPLGFSMENYDAIGRFRTEDRRKPIDATGEYITVDGQTITLSNARDLAELAATSEEAHRGFVGRMFSHVAKQPVEAYGRKTFSTLTESFTRSETNIRVLVLEIVKVSVLEGIAKESPAKTVASAK